jgi:formylglycine-generating enzyme required for sulfatase activity
VIDYLHGEDLEVALTRRKRFTVAESVSIGVKLLDALDVAHRHGFIHRDLKPSNVFLETQDQGYEPRLMDFGIAKVLEAAALTREQSFTGTPAYASPEQVESTRDVDARSDLFSMGVLLWELLGGKQPWAQYMEDPYRVLLAVVRETLPPLPSGIPAALVRVVERGLEKDLSLRWQSAADFRDGLQASIQENEILAQSVVGPGKGAVPGRLPELRAEAGADLNQSSRAPSSQELAEQARLVRTRLAASQTDKRADASKKEARLERYSSGHTIPLSEETPEPAPSPPPPGAWEPAGLAALAPVAESQQSQPRSRVERPATMLPESGMELDDGPEPVEQVRFSPQAVQLVQQEERKTVNTQVGLQPMVEEDTWLDRLVEFLRQYGLFMAISLVVAGLLFVLWDMLLRVVPLPDDFVILEPGRYQMGSPAGETFRGDNEVQHEVQLTHRFAIQSHEVTRADFEIYNLRPPPDFEDCGHQCPAINLTWLQAIQYANARSNQDELAPCYVITGEGPTLNVAWPEGYKCEGYRLPTEAEWEYAARGGTATSSWGGDVSQAGRDPLDPMLERVAIYGGNSGVEYPNAESCGAWSPVATHCGPSPVSGRLANPWGMFDMLGNASEWVWDFYAPLPAGPQVDPTGPDTGNERVARGCSYRDTAARCRLAWRQGLPLVGNRTMGFRLARTVQ